MQKEFAASLRKLFDENSFGLRTYSRRDAGGEFSACLVDEDWGIELWLRFPTGREAFSLVFVCPSNASEWTDLFRLEPHRKRDAEGFWIEARFLASVEAEIGDDAFELKSPSLEQVTAALVRSKRSHDAIAKKLGYSAEKTIKLRDGHYLTHRSEATPSFLRSLPEWPALAAVARPTAGDAEEVTADFPRVLDAVIGLGFPEFKLKVEQLGFRPK